MAANLIHAFLGQQCTSAGLIHPERGRRFLQRHIRPIDGLPTTQLDLQTKEHVSVSIVPFAKSAPGGRVHHFISWLLGSEADWLRYYFFTLCGTLTLYTFQLSKGMENSVPVIRQMFPNRSEVFYFRANFILVVALGSVVGDAFFNPKTPPQALAAGLGWFGTVTALAGRHAEVGAAAGNAADGDQR